LSEKVGGRKIERQLFMGLTNAKTGHFESFNAERPMNDVINLAVGSAAIPVFFPMTEHDSKFYYDGGTVIGIDFPTAINACRDIVEKEEDIIIDSVFCSYTEKISEKDVSGYSVYQMF
jgi:predicted patatin/cPLA2 family phospholipase